MPRARFLGLLLGLLLLPAAVQAQDFDTDNKSGGSLALFEQQRLLLLDHRGKAIGPTELGYPSRDFGVLNTQRYHAVRAGELRYRLSFVDFLELTQHSELQSRWEAAHLRFDGQRRGGLALIVVGASLALAGIVAGSIVYATNDQSFRFGLPLLFSSSAGFLAGGISVRLGAERRKRELDDHNLDDLMNRDEAWEAVGAYNDALWRSMSLGSEAPASTAPSGD